MKTEFYNRRDWPTKAEARIEVGRWIEERFNRRRRHSSIGMMTPVQYENHLHHTATLVLTDACGEHDPAGWRRCW